MKILSSLLNMDEIQSILVKGIRKKRGMGRKELNRRREKRLQEKAEPWRDRKYVFVTCRRQRDIRLTYYSNRFTIF